MKKILGIVLGLLVCVLSGIHWYAGYKAQKSLTGWLEQINQPGGYHLEFESYKRGWLTSEGVLKIGLALPQSPAVDSLPWLKDWQLPLAFKLSHGPIYWFDGFELGWFKGRFFLSSEHQAWVQQNLITQGNGQFFESEIAMDLAGDTHIRDTSQPFSVARDDATFKLAGYSGRGEFSRLGLLDYTGQLTEIEVVTADKSRHKIEGLEFSLKSDFSARVGLYVTPGGGEFTLKSITSNPKDGSPFVLENASVHSDFVLSEDKKVGKFKLEMGFANADWFGEKVKDARLDMAFENLGVEFINQFVTLTQDTNDTEQLAMMGGALLGLVNQHLLPNGPEFVISNFGFSTYEGALNLSGRIKIAPTQIGANPLEILPHITLDGTLLTDKPLAFRLLRQTTLTELNKMQFEGGEQMTDTEKQALADNQTQMKLDMLMIQGMLREKNGKYEVNVQFKDSKATINDKPFPLPF
jgi:uncharacterized protein YdgA (DUF945 family)